MRRIGQIVTVLTALALLAGLSGVARADPPAADGQATLSLSAVLNGQTAPMTDGVRWRVFSARRKRTARMPWSSNSNLAEPTLTLPPGDYVVHAPSGWRAPPKR